MNVSFMPSKITVDIPYGTSILKAMIKAGLEPDAPCGGRGSCGKCKVILSSENKEREVLACQEKVENDITVFVPENDNKHRIMMDGVSRNITLSPAVRTVNIAVPPPSTSDLRSCWDRFAQTVADTLEINKADMRPNPIVVSGLYEKLEQNKYKLEALIFEDEIIAAITPGSDILGIGYDIGTTTVAAFLLDLRTGGILHQASMLNPQVKYGADVIMRSKYSIENGIEALTNDIRNALAELCSQCLTASAKSSKDVYLITIVGNTCMHHLFLGISPASLAFAPYTAAVKESMSLSAVDYGFPVNPGAKLLTLPNIAGFVGADTVGAALAAEMDSLDKTTLLIDIGTNGEMVLGNKNRLITCSTAAGPAFEGAVISCGMRGAEGAIDHVSLQNGNLTFSVIGDVNPVGICGSGLVDLISELVRVGLIDSSGKLLTSTEFENELAYPFSNHIEITENQRCFVLSSNSEKKIILTQRDIREVQLAKGAIAAGISMMAQKLGVEISDIQTVMIAGAFGSYMLPESACGIGLIPAELKDRVSAIGNAAGEGAKITALSYPEFLRAQRLAAFIEYLELAADPDFQDVFVDCLEFPLI